MGFLIPGFLAGAVFAGIPVLLHLIHRKRAPEVIFPATRFLEIAAKRTSRRRRIDNLLLLVLRTLLLLLLAFGLAGPILKRATGAGRAGSDIVIIIDNSLSMSAVEEGRSGFGRAKEAVEEILAKTTGSDMVAFVATAPPESKAVQGLTADRSEIRSRLQRLSVSAARGSVAAALEKAGKIFSESAASAKLLYVISDMQENSFPAENALSDEARAALYPVPAIVYDCGGGVARNLCVERVETDAHSGTLGAAVEIKARIVSFSPVSETFKVSLSGGGAKLRERAVEVAAGGAVEAVFHVMPEAAGVFEGTIEVESEDSVALDNRRFFVVNVRDKIGVTLLARVVDSGSFDDDLFFIRRAIDPFGLGDFDDRRTLTSTTATYGEGADLSQADVVFLMLRPGMPVELDRAVGDFVRSGGGLVVFACGEEGLGRERHEWLPARLIATKRAMRDAGERFVFGELDFSSKALGAFEEEPAALYRTVSVNEYWMSEPGEASKVLGRFDTGDACLVEGGYGAGRVILITVAPLRKETSLPVSKFFLPLVHELAYYLAGEEGGGGEILAGETARLAAGAAGGEVVVRSPDGSRKAFEAGEDGAVLYDETLRTGCYRVEWQGGRGRGRERGVAVNTDPAESRLKRLGGEELEARLASSRVIAVSSAAEMDEALLSIEGVLALGDVLLYSVLGIAIFECLAANRVSGKFAREK